MKNKLKSIRESAPEIGPVRYFANEVNGFFGPQSRFVLSEDYDKLNEKYLDLKFRMDGLKK